VGAQDVPQLLVPVDEMSREMARGMAMLGGGGTRSMWWSAGLIALQAWAGFELVCMSAQHKLVAIVYVVIITH
jgi:hypothetical protein